MTSMECLPFVTSIFDALKTAVYSSTWMIKSTPSTVIDVTDDEVISGLETKIEEYNKEIKRLTAEKDEKAAEVMKFHTENKVESALDALAAVQRYAATIGNLINFRQELESKIQQIEHSKIWGEHAELVNKTANLIEENVNDETISNAIEGGLKNEKAQDKLNKLKKAIPTRPRLTVDDLQKFVQTKDNEPLLQKDRAENEIITLNERAQLLKRAYEKNTFKDENPNGDLKMAYEKNTSKGEKTNDVTVNKPQKIPV